MSDECGDMAVDLYDAAKSGDVVEVRRLVAAGADVEEQWGEFGMRPLHEAASQGQVEVITVLVELGVDKEAKTAGMTPLHLAVCSGRVRRSRCWCSWAWTRTRRVWVE